MEIRKTSEYHPNQKFLQGNPRGGSKTEKNNGSAIKKQIDFQPERHLHPERKRRFGKVECEGCLYDIFGKFYHGETIRCPICYQDIYIEIDETI